MAIRGIVERFGRRVVFKRRLSAEFGRLAVLVSPEAGLKFWRRDLGKTDPLLLRACRELVRPGDVVWDIGANVGLFSFAAAALAGPHGRVLAVEADTWLVDLLRRSARQHRTKAPVDVLPAAVSDSVGVGSFHIARRARAANFLDGGGSTQAGGTREINLVVTITLDWLLNHYAPPAILKIDVEAAEARVLRGASALLDAVKPLILCEVAPGNAEEVTCILKAHSYQIFDADTEAGRRRPLQQAAWNSLCIPCAAEFGRFR